MSEAFQLEIAQAVIALAKRECNCGLGGEAGSRHKHNRCEDCPLDAIDWLADAMLLASRAEP